MIDDPTPSKTISEAAERLVRVANERISELTVERDYLSTYLRAVLEAADKCSFAPCQENFALMRAMDAARRILT